MDNVDDYVTGHENEEEARTEGYRTGFADGYVNGIRSLLDGKTRGEQNAILGLMAQDAAATEDDIESAFCVMAHMLETGKYPPSFYKKDIETARIVLRARMKEMEDYT